MFTNQIINRPLSFLRALFKAGALPVNYKRKWWYITGAYLAIPPFAKHGLPVCASSVANYGVVIVLTPLNA